MKREYPEWMSDRIMVAIAKYDERKALLGVRTEMYWALSDIATYGANYREYVLADTIPFGVNWDCEWLDCIAQRDGHHGC